MRKKFLSKIVFILAVNILCSVTLFSGVLAAADPLGNISSIRIKPYNQVYAAPAPDDATFPAHIKKYRGDQFGHGAVFVYNPEVDWGDVITPLSHKNILSRLYEYKKRDFSSGKNEDKNILFVKVKFYNDDPTKNFECFFGIHVSGGYTPTKRPLTEIARDLYAPGAKGVIESTALKHFVPLKLANRLLAEHPEIRDYCLPLPLVLEKKDMEENAYLCKLFKIDSIDKPFIVLSNDAYKKTDDLSTDIINKVRKRLGGDRFDDIAATNIFGCNVADLFSPDKISANFNQSEQSFLSALESCQDFWAWGRQTSGQNYRASIDLYSYLDICVVCRGTFSRMMENGELISALSNFVSPSSSTVSAIDFVAAHSIERAKFSLGEHS